MLRQSLHTLPISVPVGELSFYNWMKQPSGCHGQTRTDDPPVNGRALYQLSYMALSVYLMFRRPTERKRILFFGAFFSRTRATPRLRALGSALWLSRLRYQLV